MQFWCNVGKVQAIDYQKPYYKFIGWWTIVEDIELTELRSEIANKKDKFFQNI